MPSLINVTMNVFALVVPVASVPVDLKLVLKVRAKLLVPDVTTCGSSGWPCAPTVVALMFSASPGVSVKKLPSV